MKDHFFGLVQRLCTDIRGDEVLLCNLSAERSDFVRFNRGAVRQAGSVEQRFVSIRLLHDGRQAAAAIAVTGGDDDLALACRTVAELRSVLAQLPRDPWLAVPATPRSTSIEHRGSLPAPEAVVQEVVSASRQLDLVGFYAGGTLYRGFANSLGQRNWHEVDSFNFDWSLYLRADKAVKTSYAGFDWDPAAFEARLDAAAEQLGKLAIPARTLEPGHYRAYLAPKALEELTGLICWGGFSARARATRQSPLLRMEHGETLSTKVSFSENIEEGVAPAFQELGFVKPSRVDLIVAGRLGDPLASPRSAKEYGLQTNAANEGESPEAIDMAAGELAPHDVLAALDTGLYVSNLWYLNFSDRPAGRITGMTRFATFWVEGGRIAAPVNAMRFDDTIYRMLGENLIDLTRERELLLDPSTYEERSTASARLPGALLRELRLTL